MLVWLDGTILPAERAQVSVLDRGFLFGDGVYEVARVVAGVPLRMPLHVERLRRSLALARIDGFDATTLPPIINSVIDAEGLRDATVYLQVTRGAMATRRHLPESTMRPTVVAFATPAPGLSDLGTPTICRAVLLPDTRWMRCAIKATSLLGSVLSVMEANDDSADEAILARPDAGGALRDDDLVSEGATSNVWAVVDGTLITPSVDDEPPILHGITRAAALSAAERIGFPTRTGPLTVAALRDASEILLTSTRRLVGSVVSLDGRPVGDGAPGPVAQRLAAAMRDEIAQIVATPQTGATGELRHAGAAPATSTSPASSPTALASTSHP